MVAQLAVTPAPTLDLSTAALVGCARLQLAETLEKMRELGRRSPRSETDDQELDWLRFWALRLGTRLHVMGEGGLLNMGAVVERDVGGIVGEAILELASELDQRSIATAIVIDEDLPLLWIDAGQIQEAIRCALDEALWRARPNGRIVVSVRVNGGDLEIAVSHNGRVGWQDGLNVALMRGLAMRMGGSATMLCDGSWSRILLRVPPQEAPLGGDATSDVREILSAVPQPIAQGA